MMINNKIEAKTVVKSNKRKESKSRIKLFYTFYSLHFYYRLYLKRIEVMFWKFSILHQREGEGIFYL